MKGIIRTYRKTIGALVLGALVGYTYYALVGCNSGSCAIASSPLISTLYGALMGVLIVGFPDNKQTSKSISHE
jgi:hypothetical protein